MKGKMMQTDSCLLFMFSENCAAIVLSVLWAVDNIETVMLYKNLIGINIIAYNLFRVLAAGGELCF